MAAQTVQDRLTAAAKLLQARRAGDAIEMLRNIVSAEPGLADAHGLLGLAWVEHGDLGAAEPELTKAIALGQPSPRLHHALAGVYARTDRLDQAEASYRKALALGSKLPATVIELTDLLVAGARFADALQITEAATRSSSDLRIWTQHGEVLKALGRLDEAIAVFRRASELSPASGVAEHNLAAALGDAEHFGDSEAATARALSKGVDAPETWLVRGRALMGQAKLAEAEAAFRESIRRRPTFVDAQAELAQLVWMTTEDVAAACVVLDSAIASNPDESALRLTKAKLLEYAGDRERAYEALADFAGRPDADAVVNLTASQLIVHTDPARALAYAETATAKAPTLVLAMQTLCSAYLAAGRPADAAAKALELRERAPLDQHAIALLATAWRLLGDDRYGDLYDYERLVRAQTIDTPNGWPSLESYLADLAASLYRLHPLRTHPVGQSLRFGTQTLQGLDRLDDPAIRAFFEAIDRPIRRYIDDIGPGQDPIRARRSGGYRFNGVWSVRLHPRGFHADHVHPMGWISSACYVALPGSVEREPEGWIKFGEPGVPTSPALGPEHFVRPQPGTLVLFPSYMWHGTVPFSGDERRLSIAFDLLPRED